MLDNSPPLRFAPSHPAPADLRNDVLLGLGEAAADLLRRSHRATWEAGEAIDLAMHGRCLAIFPESGLIGVYALGRDGAAPEVAAVGSEGILGGLEALAGAPGAYAFRAMAPTTAWLVPGSALGEAIRGDEAAARVLWEGLAAAQGAALAEAACAAQHKLKSRLADRLLHYSRQLGSRRLPLTQDLLAVGLGVARTSVTLEMHLFAKAGLTRTRRGTIMLEDAGRLAGVACGCRTPPMPGQDSAVA